MVDVETNHLPSASRTVPLSCTAEHRMRGLPFMRRIDFRSKLVGGKITLQPGRSP
jgi:hypothetical protein